MEARYVVLLWCGQAGVGQGGGLLKVANGKLLCTIKDKVNPLHSTHGTTVEEHGGF